MEIILFTLDYCWAARVGGFVSIHFIHLKALNESNDGERWRGLIILCVCVRSSQWISNAASISLEFRWIRIFSINTWNDTHSMNKTNWDILIQLIWLWTRYPRSRWMTHILNGYFFYSPILKFQETSSRWFRLFWLCIQSIRVSFIAEYWMFRSSLKLDSTIAFAICNYVWESLAFSVKARKRVVMR